MLLTKLTSLEGKRRNSLKRNKWCRREVDGDE